MNTNSRVIMSTQSYIVNDNMARAIVWVGAIGYGISMLTYIFKMIFQNIDQSFEHVVKNGLLVLGFLFLSISTTRKALIVQKDRKDMEKPEFLFQKMTRMGWACLAFHFISLYILPHHTHIYYLFALAAYITLAIGKQIGVFLLVTFYVLSSIFMFMRPVVDYIIIPSKLINMTYMGAYAYIFARQYFQKRAEEKEKQKEKQS